MTESPKSPSALAESYTRRLAERQTVVDQRLRTEANIAFSRLVIFVTAFALAWPTLISRSLHWGILVVPVVAFLGLVKWHERVIRQRERAERAVTFYRRGLARLEDAWAGTGSSGAEFLDSDHPYAADLDLFGEGSLFELICTARTHPGERRLADWLLAPADPAEIADRQEAITELNPRVDLREDIAVLGDDVRETVHTAPLAAWAVAPPLLTSIWPCYLAVVLAAVNLTAVVAFFVWKPIAILAVLPGMALALAYLIPVRKVLTSTDRPERELVLLAELLERLESERFKTPRLMRLRGVLDADGHPPSASIARLASLVEINDSRRNMLFAPIAGLCLLGTQLAFAMERWRIRCGPDVVRWLEAVAEFEALSSLAGYAYEHPADPFPTVSRDGEILDAEGLGHPLLPQATVVRNDVRLTGDLRLLLISGSNMSGKSTFLRTVGVNVVLALAGAPVRARRVALAPVTLGACMRIQDSLRQGWSHFYAEIRRLHQVTQLVGGEERVLFLFDEILHGTNSHDRRIGADALIRDLIDRGAAGLVTTHDLALCRIADDLAPKAANVHFEDQLEGERMVFDYRVRPGVVEKSNALDLMRAVGLIGAPALDESK